MEGSDEQLINVPPEQLGRQAVSSLRGYVYQLYQSLLAWLDLKEGETLLLEVAEDYAVLAQGALRATQVKNTAKSSPVTLKSLGAAKAIQALWDFQVANPNTRVYFNYLTTSLVGKEKELQLPGGQAGLIYWRSSARERADVEPLRQALKSLDLSSELLTFIVEAPPEELQDKLLRRIRWSCGAEDISDLERAIMERLVYKGEALNLSPSDAEKTQYWLILELLKVVVREDRREVNRAELLRTMELSGTTRVSTTDVRQAFRLLASSSGQTSGDFSQGLSPIVNVTDLPLPREVTDRGKIVRSLAQSIPQQGAIWLHGSSGLGKSILAQLIARACQRAWYLVELRDSSGIGLEHRLKQAALASVDTTNFGGVILDDFPIEHAGHGRLRLSLLAAEVHRRDGVLLVTSARPPSPTLEQCFGASGVHVQKAPYLTKEDVADLVRSAGGDAERWTGVIFSFCGFGHPQLIHARISGLKRRGWPNNELLVGIHPAAGPAKDVEAEREAIRVRLIEELPAEARELLYRLTLVMENFDRSLAIDLADLDPRIPRAGEAFDLLLGPWLEARAVDRFRVSPLVSHAGKDNVPSNIQVRVHRRIVDQLLTRQPFPADFLRCCCGTPCSVNTRRGLCGFPWP